MENQRDRVAEIHLTYRCDLSCFSCNRAGFVKQIPIPDLTLVRFTDTLDQIERLGFLKRLMIIGGEPTLHPECLDLMRLGESRHFEQAIWSNGYSRHSRAILATIGQERIGGVVRGTQKPKGRQENFSTQTIYCSPIDCGLTRVAPCKWGTVCGYSVDELGITVCSIGGPIAHYTCTGAYTQNLDDLLNPDWVKQSLQLLCRHCGAFLDDELKDRLETSNVNGTLMTQTWIDAFGL